MTKKYKKKYIILGAPFPYWSDKVRGTLCIVHRKEVVTRRWIHTWYLAGHTPWHKKACSWRTIVRRVRKIK